jgi:hypothetical protein
MTDKIPHPKNVPGDFYVEDGCCMSCTLPQIEAAEFFEFEPTSESSQASHCYVSKQPVTLSDLKKMAKAMQAQEIDCIRYKGADKKVIAQLRQNGLSEYIDGAA